jgi:hypothetical protein
MLSKGNTVDHAPSDIGRRRKTFQTRTRSYLQRTGETGCASSKVHKDYLARLGKRVKRVQTHESSRNLAGDSSAKTLNGGQAQSSSKGKGNRMLFVASESKEYLFQKVLRAFVAFVAEAEEFQLGLCSRELCCSRFFVKLSHNSNPRK